MKAFITSLLVILFALVIWFSYAEYAEENLSEINKTMLLPAADCVNREDFQQAQILLKNAEEKWKNFKKKSAFFADSDDLTTIDETFFKAMEYVSAADRSNGSGEIMCIFSQLNYLKEKQRITLANIF